MSEPSPPEPQPTKLPPSDPSLRIPSPRGRMLRRGRAVALGVLLVGTLLLALVLATLPRSKEETAKTQESSAQTAQVPDSIRNAPSGPAPVASRAPSSDAGAHEGPGRSTSDPAVSEAERRKQEEHELDRRAQAGAILFDTSTRGMTREDSPGGSSRAEALTNPRPSATAPLTAPSERRTGGEEDPNLQSRKNAFLEGGPASADALVGRVRPPRSPYEVKAGAIIPAVLITGINSDLPGPVIGQVRENVYDTVTGNHLLIPQGAKLLATYDSMVAWGQERVLVCWNRLVFPNGNSIDLECMPAADLEGAAGLTDSVDEHWARILKGVAIASLLSATSQSVAGSTQGFNPTLPQVWARGAASEVNSAGQQITRRNIQIQPTITVRPGFSVNVLVAKDMIVPPYERRTSLVGALP